METAISDCTQVILIFCKIADRFVLSFTKFHKVSQSYWLIVTQENRYPPIDKKLGDDIETDKGDKRYDRV